MVSQSIAMFGTGSGAAEPDIQAFGNKGANLVAMASIGLPIPPGCIINTSIGAELASLESKLSDALLSDIQAALDGIGKSVGRTYGDDQNPLLISVRSGAAVSMPGMMDTVLNLGLNDQAVEGLSAQFEDERFAWDTYRRFMQSYSNVVLGLDESEFELVLEELRAKYDCETDSALPAEGLKEAVSIFKELVGELAAAPFPQDPREQLETALLAVFRSWNTQRATRYRDMHGYTHEGGTAAIIQAMVFGNRDDRSCTGVYFTRNPSTGVKLPYGEYLLNAQGEDVVSGFRTPNELTEASRAIVMSEAPSMEKALPNAFAELLTTGDKLEAHFTDVQEIEFTVESDRLWLLQTRGAKRTPAASLKIAVEMAEEGILTKQAAAARIDDDMLAPMLVSKVSPGPDDKVITKGLPASPGAVSGIAVFTSEDAVAAREEEIDVILVRTETDPKDVHGMHASVGILTSRGGMTSHAAVVARGMNKPCITAAMTLKIDTEKRVCSSMGIEIYQGDEITIDGGSGEVFLGRVETSTPEPDGDLAKLLSWKETV